MKTDLGIAANYFHFCSVSGKSRFPKNVCDLDSRVFSLCKYINLGEIFVKSHTCFHRVNYSDDINSLIFSLKIIMCQMS